MASSSHTTAWDIRHATHAGAPADKEDALWIQTRKKLDNRASQLITAQMLDDLLSLIRHNQVKGGEDGRSEVVVNYVLEIFETAHKGFELLSDGSLPKNMLCVPVVLDPYHFAMSFVDRLDKNQAKAEEFVEAVMRSLQAYQHAMATYDTPSLQFADESVKKRIIAILEMLRESAIHGFYKFPARVRQYSKR